MRIVKGDVLVDPKALQDAVAGQDAVVSSLGACQSFKPDNLIARSMPAIVGAMERSGVRRLVVVSAFGVGDSKRDAPLVPRLFFRFLLKDIYADKKAGEELRALDWVRWTRRLDKVSGG